MTFQELLDELAEAAHSNRGKGTQFEKLIANYLLTDPQYADRLADVWLWEEWPDRWSTDVGIDLVARERGTGEYWAIQCKFLTPTTISKRPTSTRFSRPRARSSPPRKASAVSPTVSWSLPPTSGASTPTML